MGITSDWHRRQQFCIFQHSISIQLLNFLDRQISAAESRANGSRVVDGDLLDGSVKAGSKQEQTNEQNKDVDDRHDGPASTLEPFALVEMVVRDSEEDEAKEAVEGGAKKGEEIAHGRNDLGEDEADDPDANHDNNPHTPADECVGVSVSGVAHQATVDILRSDIGVNDSDDDRGDDNEGERTLLVVVWAQRSKSWSGGVLAEIAEADRWWYDEQEGRDCGEDVQSLGKVLGLLHLRNEGWEEDLGDPEEGDVEDGTHLSDKSLRAL